MFFEFSFFSLARDIFEGEINVPVSLLLSFADGTARTTEGLHLQCLAIDVCVMMNKSAMPPALANVSITFSRHK